MRGGGGGNFGTGYGGGYGGGAMKGPGYGQRAAGPYGGMYVFCHDSTSYRVEHHPFLSGCFGLILLVYYFTSMNKDTWNTVLESAFTMDLQCMCLSFLCISHQVTPTLACCGLLGRYTHRSYKFCFVN